VRRSCPRFRDSRAKEHDSGTSHDLFGCAGSHRTDGIGRARPRTEIRHPGSEAHRSTAEGEARHHHIDPVVSGAQRNRWQREGGRVGQGSGRAARCCSGAAAQGTKRERQAQKREVDDSVFGIFKDVEECTQLSYRGTENIWCRRRTSVWAKRPNTRFSKPHSNTRHPRAAPATPGQPQAGNLGKEVGGGQAVGRRAHLQGEVPYAREPKAR